RLPDPHRTPAAGRRGLRAAAGLALVAATALGGCRDGEGVRDEGPSAARLDRPAAGPAQALVPTPA
ncbi:murein L,D-transpeptidase, partial [Streptomyces sp. NPDC054770]